jgi:predicted kinase
MKTVIILRGLPGSGKSTVAKFFEPCTVISMDKFWTRGGRDYKFDYAQLEEAIKWTHQRFMTRLTDEEIPAETIVVDNVSYGRAHYQFFLSEAKARGHVVHVVHIERPLDELNNVHRVPDEQIARMAAKWEPHK